MSIEPQLPLSAIQQKRQYHLIYKSIICSLLFAGFLSYRLSFTAPNVACIVDAYHDATVRDNRDMVQDRNQAAYQGNNNQLTITGQAFIGTGQVLMDLWIAILGVIWLIKVKNVRGFGGIAGFFLTRSIIFLNIQKFPYPEFIAWRSPGFFSFTVPYDHTRDFFYSGHTGTLTLIFLEMCILQLKIPSIFAFLSMIFMMNMLLITRVHYVADIIGGLVFAIWYHRTATRFVVYIDKLLSLPYFIVKWLYINKCNSCKNDDQTDSQRQQAPPGSTQSLKKEIQLKPSSNIFTNELIQIESKNSRNSS